MKTFFKILFLTVLAGGIISCADAQRRGRDNGGSSERGSRSEGNSYSQRGASRENFSQQRGGGNFSAERRTAPSNFQRQERQEPNANRENNMRNFHQRSAVTRNDSRDNRFQPQRDNRFGTGRVNTTSSERFDRGNRNERFNNNYAYNNNRYGYNNNRFNTSYRGGGYYSYNNRRYSFMSGTRYSSIPRGYLSINFGGSPYYYNHGSFYGYYGGYYQPLFPPIGIRIGVLPFGYSRLYVGAYPYYYYNGIYYRQYDDNDYEVVDPPMGAAVYTLPEGAKSVVVNGEEMYELNGTYYKEDADANGRQIFTVVGKNGEINNTGNGDLNNGTTNLDLPSNSLQIGDVVSQLPEGTKVMHINGEKTYVTPDNTYLKEETNNGVVEYKVVGR